MLTNHAKSYLQSEESKENNTTSQNVNLQRKRRCAQLLQFTKKRKPPPPPPSSPLNLIEVDVPPPPPPPLLGSSGSNSSNDHQNSESNSTSNSSDGNNNECFHVDEPMEIDPNNAETKILAQNPLPDRVKKGSFFTFEIAGFEDAARRMAQMKEEQSFEERMAFIVGRIVEHKQIERKKELDKRLNREDVRMRNEMLKMKHAAIQSETIVQFQLAEQELPIEHQNQQQEQWNAPVIEVEAIENGHQNNSQENVMMERVEQGEKWPPLQLIGGIPVPFSWKTFLENLRTDMAASEAAAAIASSSTSAMPSTENSVEIANQNEKETANNGYENGSNEGQRNEESTTTFTEQQLEMKVELEDGEIIEFDELRVKTPPPLKKRKRKSGANSSKEKKNLTSELLLSSTIE